MFLGPQDSSASLPFSLLAACANGPVADNSDGALAAAASAASSRGEEGRREVPCSLQAMGTGWEGRFSLEYVNNRRRVHGSFTHSAGDVLGEKSLREVC